MFGTTVASFLACCVFKVVPCKASISPYFYFTRIMTTGFLIALSFQAGNTAYLYLSGALACDVALVGLVWQNETRGCLVDTRCTSPV
jgi:hypothetical protein